MKKLFVSAIIVLVAINLGLYAQEKDMTQAESEVKLELMWEKEFEGVINDYVVETNKIGEALLRVVSFLKDNGKKAEVHFLNLKGLATKKSDVELIRLRSEPEIGGDVYGGVLTSKNGKYIGLFQVTKRDPERIGEISFHLYDKAGNFLWTKTSWNVRPSMLLSDGSILSFEGEPCTWSPFALYEKNILRGWLKPNDGEPMEVTGAFDASENSNIVFNVYDFDKKEGQVVLYDNTAKEIWRNKFNNWVTASKVCISDNGRIITARGGFANTLYTFSNDGTLLWQKHIGVGYLQIFSSDGSYLAASGPSNRIYYLRATTGDSLWTFIVEDNRSFFSLAVSKNGNFVATADGGGMRELPAGDVSTIFLFDRRGNLVWQKELLIQKERTPNVRFTDDGRHLLIANANKVYCYKILGGGQ
jgi:outer membrane protein assembly factor BamB